MTEDKKFPEGFYAKKPTRDFIKCQISIKKADFADWFRNELKTSDDEWINIDIKENKENKFYAEVNTWKPKEAETQTQVKSTQNDNLKSIGQTIEDEIPF